MLTFLPAVDITAGAVATGNQFLTPTAFIIVFNVLTIACALLRPCRLRTANISGVVLPVICSSAVALAMSSPTNVHSTTIVAVIAYGFILSLPHCVFYGYIVYRLGKLLKQYCCKGLSTSQCASVKSANAPRRNSL